MCNSNNSNLARFACRLCNILHEKNMTQGMLSKMLGLKSISTVSNWCAGNNYPTISQLINLSHALDVDINYLLDEEPHFDESSIESDIRNHLGLWKSSVSAIHQLVESSPRALNTLNLILSSDGIEARLVEFDKILRCIYK